MQDRSKKAIILSHRGLNQSRDNWFAESSYEAFKFLLQHGIGLEFDVNFIKGDQIVIAHDATLERITEGADKRPFSEISRSEIPFIVKNGSLCLFEELMELIRHSTIRINALHFKGVHQIDPFINTLFFHLEKYASDLIDRLIIFDVKPEVARELLTRIPGLQLAPSVAHPHDVKRFNDHVGGSLLTVDEAARLGQNGEKLYSWVWLDEWDLSDKNGGKKKFYTRQVFEQLREAGYKIALVTPELHGTSPGLLGGEAHPDAKTNGRLFSRISEILLLGPDVICTDWPEQFKDS